MDNSLLAVRGINHKYIVVGGNMFLGVHLSTYTANWDEPVVPLIYQADKTGFDMVEIPLMSPDTFDVKETKKALKQTGLFCTCGTGMNPDEDVSAKNQQTRDAGIRRLKKCLDICNALEADALGGVLYAPWGRCIPRETMQEQYKYAIESLKQVAEYAKEKGVCLSLEILNRYESSFINTMEEGLTLIDQIGHPNAKLHFDTFHAYIEERNMSEAIRQAGDAIYHVHLCDNNRAAPGSGAIDFLEVLDELNSIGYQRNLVIENFVIPNSQAGNEVCVWRRCFETPEENVKYGYRYISDLMEERGLRNA